MSGTRHAKPGGAFRQERFASSGEQGLLANLVAKRCSALVSPEDRASIWFAQWGSWQPGGLPGFLQGMREALGLPAAERKSTADLVSAIQKVCLDPTKALSPGLISSLADYKSRWMRAVVAGVETSIGMKVDDALAFTQGTKCLTIIDGQSRLGKSFAAKECCRRSAGAARYVQVPASNDDISFFREIGRSLGVSSSLQLKAAEIKARVEDTLQGGDLMVVFDEAHYLWPQSWQRYAMPSRVNWIMTALVNHHVPVALVTTPQFHAARRQVERLTGWNSDQFLGRVGHMEVLPDTLAKSDLVAVASAMLPECDTTTLQALAEFASRSRTHLGGLTAIASRARWFASKAGHSEVSQEDVRKVMRERVSTFDNPLSEKSESWGSLDRSRGLGQPSAETGRGRRRAAASPLRNAISARQTGFSVT